MVDRTREGEDSRLATNRLALVVVVCSLLVAAAVVFLARADAIAAVVPEHGPAADAVPLYLLAAVGVLVLIAWSWGRLLSWFE
ncbi:hypothetical protein [Natronolimnohabitans innermongolicus]|uniref:Uncharacterized protein n=1 Tax=Natronolimnohabitans innermongolicus JCM 12255 TaxID=1227499 RepID=L9XDG1_9EURY|nr:hypothetical protein [Natronolimnohabitans innermongolicus]ELY58658.1 hypothetical protein C493_06627 [Natronolimnohabitans innermongolicus JCM 12255]